MATAAESLPLRADNPLVIAGRTYTSRLLVGTGKYRDNDETRLAIEASGAQIITVAIRRTNIGQNPDEPNLLDVIPVNKYTLLPNTAGCYTVEDAVRTCRLARELLDGHSLVKLEVLGDEKTLFPDVTATLEAAEILVRDGFDVMVYTNDDPLIAKRLEEIVAHHDVLSDAKEIDALIELAGKKQVPCLVVDGKPMHESKDINRFLYEAFCG